MGASGPLADRALRVAGRVASHLETLGLSPVPLDLRIVEAPDEHVGLGTGTQLSLAVARAVAMFAGSNELRAPHLATMTGRGVRSGVGIHGFDRGGLIVEGGHKREGGIAPLLSHARFPRDWHVLVLVPPMATGRHGSDELEAFATLPPMPEAETNRLCRLVLLGILPAVIEEDLDAFGAAVSEMQHRVGSWFAPVQGGVFASKALEETAAWMRGQGLRGVGQSSWGPTIYGFSAEGDEWRKDLLARLRERFGGEEIGSWAAASDFGAKFEGLTRSSPTR